MKIDFLRKKINDSFVNFFENKNIAFGYTEKNFNLNDLSIYFKHSDLIELEQIHSNIIFQSSQVEYESKGDGIILDQKNKIAIIKTADCIPLFFWDDIYSYGGIIHIGWRGLHKEIELNLIESLKNKSIKLENLNFFFGPSIEKDCYEVDQNIYTKFKNKKYRNKIFFANKKKRYLMDIKKGISYSLIKSGVIDEKITYSKICTFCDKKLPSYRREKKSNLRIYNFLILK